DLQDPAPRRGFGPAPVHMATGKRDQPAEGAVAALGPVYFVPGRFAGGVSATLDRQPAIFHGDLHLADRYAGNLDRHHVSVRSLGYVDRRPPGRGGTVLLADPAARPPGHSQALRHFPFHG